LATSAPLPRNWTSAGPAERPHIAQRCCRSQIRQIERDPGVELLVRTAVRRKARRISRGRWPFSTWSTTRGTRPDASRTAPRAISPSVRRLCFPAWRVCFPALVRALCEALPGVDVSVRARGWHRRRSSSCYRVRLTCCAARRAAGCVAGDRAPRAVTYRLPRGACTSHRDELCKLCSR
jgi:hypothetical protein